MEARSSGSPVSSQAWLWVIALGSSILIYSTIEAWLYWTAYHRLGITVFEQLSAVVFAKSMRRKDIKGSRKSETDDSKPLDAGEVGKPSSVPEEDDEDGGKTRQATINLVAVDAKRVSDFAAFNYIIITTFVKLTVAFTFLARLIGWKSLCAGLLVSAVVTPVNVFAARRYTSAQTSLMKFRDQKMAVVTEVLQGIRQIKFSALEERWEKKILDLRNTELGAQWTAYVYDIVLISIWVIGPIMLSAVSLGAYSLLHGNLSASIAFTTMAVFGSIEFSLAILPEVIADFAEAYVSAERIEKHLESPERVQETVPADAISFEKATLAWPADDADDNQERFTLQNLNLSFPPKALSVISGRTGSGKSLLLSAILGEAEILDGIVRVPVPPPLEQRFDDRAAKANWIVDSAIAYVAQVPWIENASIKDNILFGLPFDQERYRKVMFACALEKDLEMLPDGELTDIGANGINLSGGQKWRISFARALYSRAGILVLDDLFSALDAHTGRHLHVHALIGELCQGRTRILVTHHVGLCLPATDYCIHLENGVVQHSGPVEELKRTGSLGSILAQDEGDVDGANRKHQPKDISADDTLDPDEGLNLQRIISHRSQISANEHVIDPPSDQKQPPKVFQQDEKREIGAVKLSHYLTYVTDGGGWFYWFLVIICFSGYVVSGVAKVSVHATWPTEYKQVVP
jgi:ABC-type multidrug transport system fused ATPase/permease subunit